jgi:hypothetical protein
VQRARTRGLGACGAILLGLGSVASGALAVDANVFLSANQAPFCEFNAVVIAPAQPNILVHSSGTSLSILEIVSPIDLATGSVSGASFTLSLASACNTSSRVVLVTENGGLKPDASWPSAAEPYGGAWLDGIIAARIDYAASAAWHGVSLAELTTNGTAGATSVGGNVPGPRAGDVVINFNIDPSSIAVPAAGSYSDILTVRLEAQ